MDHIVLGEILIAGLASLLISIFLGPKYIQYLRQREFGQQIREEGPQDHHVTKAGTPTMGGLVIFTAIAIPYLILSDRDTASLSVFGVAVACAAIGFVDDWLKIVKARSLGLSARTKLSLQLLIAVGLWYVATHTVGLDETLRFRVFQADVDIGGFYVLLVFLVLAGATNGVNLTDGLDGLAAGTGIIALLAFTLINVVAFIRLRFDTKLDMAIAGAALVGALIGFLWYNAFPAEVFMGDTGAMAVGGALAALAIFTQTTFLLLLIGGIFLIEALSVIVQVFSFKYLGRRVLLMAPIHYHFEMKAWSETKIMVRFWIVTAILCATGFALYYRDFLYFTR